VNSRSQRGSILTWFLLALVVVVAGAAAVYWFAIRSDADPVPELDTTTNTVPGGTLDGTWRIRKTDQFGSYVQYRVEEQIVGALKQKTTGRTSAIKATLQVDGSTITNVSVEADVSKLESDKVRRDEKLRTDGLQTDLFPTATFVLTEPIELGSVPRKGKRLTADAVGDFTLHGVTKRVTIPLEGRWDGESVQVVGKGLPIEFADYLIIPPNIADFVTVADKGRVELQLIFVKP
jgi:polyisoprenoid-binding protein YceI